MAIKRRYINAQYENPRGGEAALGNVMWIKAKVQRGSRPQPPTLTWYADRAANDDDELYIADPTFDVPGGQEQSEVRWAMVDLPAVTGVRWSFEVVRHKIGKADKTIRIPDVYETWKRIYLDVTAADAGLFRLLEQALPAVQRYFSPACIEVVLNRVEIDGVPRRGHTTDKSRKAGRVQGDVFTLDMMRPQQDVISKTVTFWLEDNATNCAFVTRHGSELHFTLNAAGSWSPDAWLKGLEIKTAADVELASMKYYGRADGAEVDRDVVAAAMREAISTRHSDRVVHFRLDAAPLANRYDADARTWSVPRATSVVDGLAAGRLTFELDLVWRVRGGVGGQQVNHGQFDTRIDRGPNALATVLAHEFAHACGLVRAQSTRRYAAGRARHASNVPARPAGNHGVDNDRYYTAAFGGSGTHCSLGAEQVESCITPSGQTYQRHGQDELCVMFHATTVDDDDVPYNAGFCPRCVKQLRGR